MTNRGLLLIAVLWGVMSTSVRAEVPWAHPVERRGATLIQREHIDRFIDQFQLDEDRAVIARALFTQFTSELRALRDEKIIPTSQKWDAIIQPMVEERQRLTEAWRESMSELGGDPPTGDHLVTYQKMRDISERISEESLKQEIELAKIADEQAAIEEAFVENLRVLLTMSERDRWPTYRRWLDRQRYLSKFTWYPEVGVDLLGHIEAIELTEADIIDRTTFDAVCLEYELAIDQRLAELVAWHIDFSRHRTRRQLEQNQASRPVLIYNDQGRIAGSVPADPETGQRIHEFHLEGKRAEQRLRDINQDYRTRLIGQLTAPAAEAFRLSIEAELLGRYWDSERSHAFGLVRQLDAKDLLTEDQRHVIQTWLDELDRYRLGLARELLELSNERLDTMAEDRNTSEVQTRQREAEDRLWREGYERDDEVMERLWSQLTPEQQAQIEKPKPWPIR